MIAFIGIPYQCNSSESNSALYHYYFHFINQNTYLYQELLNTLLYLLILKYITVVRHMVSLSSFHL